MGKEGSGDSELANLTVSIILSLAYLATVCWIFPVIPMAIVSIFELSVTTFLAIWLGGSILAGFTFFYFRRKM